MTRTVLRPWEVLESRYVLRDRWMSLRADRCVTQRAATLDPYYVLEYPEWVHVAAFDEEDRLVLIRQYRHGAGAISLELPGGMMGEGDRDPVAAAARELLEETGHDAVSFRHVMRLSPNPATHANGTHLIVAKGARQIRAPELDASEDIVVEYVPWRRALHMALSGEMIHAQNVAMLLVALAQEKGVTFGP